MLPSIPIQALDGSTNAGNPASGKASIQNIELANKTIENILTFDKDLSSKFHLNALLGYSYYQYNYTGNSHSAGKFPVAQTNLIDNIQGGNQDTYSMWSGRNRTELQSYFGRVEARIGDNLIVNASVRADGTSKTGENNKYGTFPAVGVAYKLIQNQTGNVNLVKIRGNWGITGNSEFAANSALAKAIYENGSLKTVTNPNKDLKWETTTSYGGGVDFGFFENKLTGSVDYFVKETRDLIFPTPAESSVPGASVTKFINLPGILQNSGLEIALNYNFINTDNTTLNVGVNAAFLSNEMKDFPLFINTGAIHGQGLTGAYGQVITNGYPIYSYFMREWLGFDNTGNSIYVGPDGNPTGLGSSAPMMTGKSALPKMTLGFNVDFTHKNWDANVSLYGAFGQYIYNNTANALFFKGAYLGNRNVPLDIATTNQIKADPNSPSTKYLEKGDYLKIGNLTVGYSLDKDAIGGLAKYIDKARIFVSGSNLYTFTKYSGFDPEVDINKEMNGVPSAGMDYLSYPSARTYTIGFNVTF